MFYEFRLEDRVPDDHLLRRVNGLVAAALANLCHELAPFYSHTGRPSIDPELMIRKLIVGYCYGIRSKRRLCEEVSLNLAYRWFCRLDIEDVVPDHLSFSKNRHGRFRESDILRHLFERVVGLGIDAGLVKGEGFAVDASVMETHHRFERMRLRGLSGARDEFHLAAIVQNLKTMALRLTHTQALVPAT